jgi:hypothetical protein
MLVSISRTNNPMYQLDPRLQPGSPANIPSPRLPPADGFYTQVTYKGAFDSNDLWMRGWTALDAYGFLPAASSSPELNATLSSGSMEISFASESGMTYQLQSLTNVTSTNWSNEGNPRPGTGTSISIPVGTTNPARYFRVQAY